MKLGSKIMLVWLPGCRVLDVHRHRDCHRLSITLGPLGFRWSW